jgi:hypothetical protein
MDDRDWTIRMRTGDTIRIKRWHDMVEGEVFQESIFSAARSIMDALSYNEDVAHKIYADIQGEKHFTDKLDARAWKILLHAFEHGRYVVVPLHVDPAKYGWAAVSKDDRRVYVMRLLVGTYGFSVNAAAGIVGNLTVESYILPDRLERSSITRPLRAPTFPTTPQEVKDGNGGPRADFSPDDVMNRSNRRQSGPFFGGVGLAQWTWWTRRDALFHRKVRGHDLGTSILSNMDAQVQYLASEIRGWGDNLFARLTAAGLTVNDACDLIAYYYEAPGAVFDPNNNKRKLPIADPRVQKVFQPRRDFALDAWNAYKDAQAGR